MPIPLLVQGFTDGLSSIPYVVPILRTTAGISVVVLLKRFFGGARNKATRLMHSKVVIITV
jgi:hypothetical protein